MIDREKLKAYCEGFGVLLSPEQLDQFDGCLLYTSRCV